MNHELISDQNTKLGRTHFFHSLPISRDFLKYTSVLRGKVRSSWMCALRQCDATRVAALRRWALVLPYQLPLRACTRAWGNNHAVTSGSVKAYVPAFFSPEHNHTPSGKKMVTGVQVITTASQVQSIGCMWQALFVR